MEVTAPHLVHPLPMLTPVNDAMPRSRTAFTWGGLQAGDVLRRSAHTTTRTLPRPRRLNATETLGLAPALRADTLRGGLLAWDGQLEDDARLVVTVARTAASYGAHVRTRARVTSATGAGVTLRDELTGATYDVRARAVVNATGVWAGDLDEQVRLRPSRGTHLVLRGSALPHTRVAVMVPIPDTTSRFAMVLPQPDGTIYVGLTDEPVTGPVPDVPEPSEAEIDFLLGVVASAFTAPPTRRRRRRRLRRPAAAARGRRHRRDVRPVPTPRHPHVRHRRDDRGGRQAHDLPADGAGHPRRARRRRAPGRGPVPHRVAPPARRRRTGRPAPHVGARPARTTLRHRRRARARHRPRGHRPGRRRAARPGRRRSSR